jgi:hypothetical protein
MIYNADPEAVTQEIPAVRPDDTQELPVVPVEEPSAPGRPSGPTRHSRRPRGRVQGRDVLLLAGGVLALGGMMAVHYVVTSGDPVPRTRPQVQDLMVVTSPPPSLSRLVPKKTSSPRKTAHRTIAPTEAPMTVRPTRQLVVVKTVAPPKPTIRHSQRPSPTPPPVVETTSASPSPSPSTPSADPTSSLPELPLPTITETVSPPPEH